MVEYGTPGAGDATAEREKRIIAGAKRRVEKLERLDQILNRPRGSFVNKTKEEKREMFEFMLNNPEETVAQIQQRAQARGPDWALYEFLKQAEELGYARRSDNDGNAE